MTKNWKQVPSLNLGQISLVENGFIGASEAKQELLQFMLKAQAPSQCHSLGN